eukprot:CAMPEP_0119393116 /NCGR_PEP_ID=MMETSP1334-20130426/124275_1 /TAXON_ID=127549 /ORGANISM="Calcidiscus leptoporus, Strain RCC1130" /LENGTH=72 /DNA_ID=CAMNT_0007416119 /DNA_START=128 /DNA_END=343 /DNA_ORIENTATION=+
MRRPQVLELRDALAIDHQRQPPPQPRILLAVFIDVDREGVRGVQASDEHRGAFVQQEEEPRAASANGSMLSE